MLEEWIRRTAEATDRHYAWVRNWTVRSSTDPNCSRTRPTPWKKLDNYVQMFSRDESVDPNTVLRLLVRTGCKPVNSLASLNGCSGPLSGKLAGNTSPLLTITPATHERTSAVNPRSTSELIFKCFFDTFRVSLNIKKCALYILKMPISNTR